MGCYILLVVAYGYKKDYKIVKCVLHCFRNPITSTEKLFVLGIGSDNNSAEFWNVFKVMDLQALLEHK